MEEKKTHSSKRIEEIKNGKVWLPEFEKMTKDQIKIFCESLAKVLEKHSF